MTSPLIPKPVSFSDEWVVQADYFIEEDNLYGSGKAHVYKPQDEPDLPFELAKLASGNVSDIINFARRWGLLGHEAILERDERLALLAQREMTGKNWFEAIGEPVEWILDHANNLSFCLGMLEYLGKADQVGLREFLRLRMRPWVFPVNGLDAWLVPPYEGDLSDLHFDETDISKYVLDADLNGDAIAVGRRLLPTRVNSHIGELQLNLISDSSHQHNAYGYHFTAMIEIAYLHVAELATREKGVARCPECQHYFKQSRFGQQYCPPTEGLSESQCAQKARYKNNYERTRQKRQTRIADTAKEAN